MNNNLKLLKLFLKNYHGDKFYIDEFNFFFGNEEVEGNFQNLIDSLQLTHDTIPGEFTLNSKITNENQVRIVFSSQKNTRYYPSLFIESPQEEKNLKKVKIHYEETKLKNETYEGSIFILFKIFINGNLIKEEKVEIGKIPIMIGSRWCNVQKKPTSLGGFFIIKGINKVLVSFEHLKENHFINTLSEKERVIKIYSSRKFFSTTNSIIYNQYNKEIDILIPLYRIKKLPLLLILLVLYEKSLEELNIFLEKFFQKDFEKKLHRQIYLKFKQRFENKEFSSEFYEKDSVDNKYKLNFLISNAFFPHIEDISRKFYSLLFKYREIISLNFRKNRNLDYLGSKIISTPISLYRELLSESLSILFKDLKNQLEKNYSKKKKISIFKELRNNLFLNRIKYSFSTGMWPNGRKGVIQLLDITNKFSIFSHIRRIVNEVKDDNITLINLRELHPSYIGKTCCIETPEGQEIGLRKNFAIFSRVSLYQNSKILKEFLEKNSINFRSYFDFLEDKTNILINNVLFSFILKSEVFNFLKKFKNYRSKNPKIKDVSISFFNDEIHIFSDFGRIMRPVLILESEFSLKKLVQALNDPEITFQKLEDKKLITWIDFFEERTSNILISLYPDSEKYCKKCQKIIDKKFFYDFSLKKKIICPYCNFENFLNFYPLNQWDYLELSPLFIFGMAGLLIPFAENSHAIRGLLSVKMLKQSISNKNSSIEFLSDNNSYFLEYSEKPILKNHSFLFEDLYYGQNVFFSINSFREQNIDDSIIFKKSSLERGLFSIYQKKIYRSLIHDYDYEQKDLVELVPENTFRRKISKRYSYIEESGFSKFRTLIPKGDILMGKTSPFSFSQEDVQLGYSFINRRMDTSIVNKMDSYVEKIIVTFFNDKKKFIRIETMKRKKTQLGDKFSSRNGQKGIVGRILKDDELPFTSQGISADILFNSQGIPSRMTYSSLLEVIGSKANVLSGRNFSSDSFLGVSEDEISQILEGMGYNASGKEFNYNGITGKKTNDVVYGIMYYQKLIHLAEEKIFYRKKGPVQVLTRQPTEGKNKLGGIRFGEMEKSCLVAHGASNILKEILLNNSDFYYAKICSNKFCRRLIPSEIKNKCLYCNSKYMIKYVKIPYSYKLLHEELFALGIDLRYKLGSEND